MEQEKLETVAEASQSADPSFSYFPTDEATSMLMEILLRHMNEYKERGTRPSNEFTNISMQVCFGVPVDLLKGIADLEQRMGSIETGMCEKCQEENIENGNQYTCHGVLKPGDLLRCFMAVFARVGYEKLLTEAVEGVAEMLGPKTAPTPHPGHIAGNESSEYADAVEFVKKHSKK